MNGTICRTTRRLDAYGDPELVEKNFVPNSEIKQNLKSLMESRTAGDPDDSNIVFTDLTPPKSRLTCLAIPSGKLQWHADMENLKLFLTLDRGFSLVPGTRVVYDRWGG